MILSKLSRMYKSAGCRLWSLLPTLYTLLTWAQHGGPRLLLMAAVTSVWSARLTWNFWRRGGYSWPPWTGTLALRLLVLESSLTSSIISTLWSM